MSTDEQIEELKHELDNALIREELLSGILAAHGIEVSVTDNEVSKRRVASRIFEAEISVGEAKALIRCENMSIADYCATWREEYERSFRRDISGDPYRVILTIGEGRLTRNDALELLAEFERWGSISRETALEHINERRSSEGLSEVSDLD